MRLATKSCQPPPSLLPESSVAWHVRWIWMDSVQAKAQPPESRHAKSTEVSEKRVPAPSGWRCLYLRLNTRHRLDEGIQGHAYSKNDGSVIKSSS